MVRRHLLHPRLMPLTSVPQTVNLSLYTTTAVFVIDSDGNIATAPVSGFSLFNVR